MRWSLGIFLLAAVASAEPQQVKLGWLHSWSARYKGGDEKASREPPTDCNPVEGEDIWYVEFKLAPERTLLIALQSGHSPPRAWIDFNFDGQVTDEKPVPLNAVSSVLSVSFEIGWRDTKGAEPHRLPARLSVPRDLSDGKVTLKVLAHRHGYGVIGGRRRWIVAVSGDYDLRVDNEDTDGIYIDLDGDGSLTTQTGSHERVIPGQPFRAGKFAYVLKLEDATGASMRFTQVEKAPPLRARPWPKPPETPYYPYARRTSRSSRSLKERMSSCETSFGRYDPKVSLGTPWELRSIGTEGTVKSVKFLIRMAKKTKHVELRNAATRALGNVRNRPHAKYVMAAARGGRNDEFAPALLRALDSMEAKGRYEFFLKRLVADKRPAVQRTAAELVAGAGPARNQELGRLVGATRTPAAEYFAYEAATRYAPVPPNADLVRKALESKDVRLRMVALWHTGWIGFRDTQAEMTALAAAEVEHRRIGPELARLMIGSLAPVAGPAEIPLLFAAVPHVSRKARTALVDWLTPIRDAAVAALVREQLQSKDKLIRNVAARVLAKLPEPENGPAMAERLATERDPDVRASLVVALGRRKEMSAAAALVGILRTEKKDDKLIESAMAALARIGFTAPAAADFFKREGGSSTWTRRLDATDVVARYGDESAVPFLADRLPDNDWRIRVAAAQGLGRIRSKDAVGPLIDRLGIEEHRHTRRVIGAALFRTTGESFYDIHKLWAKWWASNSESFRVPELLPTKKKKNNGERKTVAQFYGVPVESDKVVFVIDQSGSMGSFSTGENDLDRAVKQTINVIKRLRDGSLVNVIFFETDIHPWSKKLVKLTKKTRARLNAHVLKQRPTGGTNLYDGLELALKMRGVEVIYLLSDGSPGSGKFVNDEDILREIGKRNRRLRVQIHCVSIGIDSDLLKKLAEQSGGTYTQK